MLIFRCLWDTQEEPLGRQLAMKLGIGVCSVTLQIASHTGQAVLVSVQWGGCDFREVEEVCLICLIFVSQASIRLCNKHTVGPQ